METLKITSILFAIPAGISLVILAFWAALARVGVQRLFAMGGIISIFACALVILFASIWEPAVNVQLKGMRFSIDERLKESIAAREGIKAPAESQAPVAAEFRIGGGRDPENGVPPDDILVEGYPRDAFRLVVLDGKMTLKPGAGHHSRLLVISGGKLVGLDHEEALPRMLPVGRDDRIIIDPVESRSRLHTLTLGSGPGQFDPPDLNDGGSYMSLGGELTTSGLGSVAVDLKLGRDAVFSVNVREPEFSLTFDDGPSAEHTPRLLDILKAEGVKATFFVLGENAKRNPDIIRRIVEEGHELGNHTLTHPTLTQLGEAAIEKELELAANTIPEDVAEKGPLRFFRPPGGALRRAQREAIFEKFGYQTVMWSVDPRDWTRPGSEVVTSRTVNGANPGGIVVLHDIHGPTIDAVPAIIRGLRNKGLRLVRVSDLLAKRIIPNEEGEMLEAVPELPALTELPPDAIRLGRVGSILKLEAGKGWSDDMVVSIDGKEVPLGGDQSGGGGPSSSLAYRPGETTLSVYRRDSLAGEVGLKVSTFKSEVSWRADRPESREFFVPIEIFPDQRDVRLGGGLADAVYLQGFPADAFRIRGVPANSFRDKNDLPSWEIYPGTGWSEALKMGLVHENWLGRNRPAEDGEELILSGLDGRPAGKILVGGPKRELDSGREREFLALTWKPTTAWDFRLPTRVVEVPFIDYPINLPIQLEGQRRIYPLREGATQYSAIRSSLVYGMGAWAPGTSAVDSYVNWFHPSRTGASLLVVDTGVKVFGPDGEEKTGGNLGEIVPGGRLEFWELLANTELRGTGDIRLPTQAGAVETLRRLGRWESFSRVAIQTPENDGGDAYLIVDRGVPAIETVRERLLRDLARIEKSEDFGLSFSINDPLDFSSREQRSNLQFGGMSSVFRECYADITLMPTKAEAKALKLNLKGNEFLMTTGAGPEVKIFGKEIQIGGKNQLVLDVIKRDVPKKTMGFVLLGGLITLIVGWGLLDSAGGFAVLAGVSVLTCARVLFSHAALVSFPYNQEALPLALWTMLLMPFVCGAAYTTVCVWISRHVNSNQVVQVTTLAGSYLFIMVFAFQGLSLEMGKALACVGLLTAALALPVTFLIARGGGGRMCRNARELTRWLGEWVAGLGYKALWGALAFVVGLRILLFFGGMKESLDLFGRFALSIIFVPLLILLFVLATQRFLRQSVAREKPALLNYLGFVAGLFIFQAALNGLVISDIGSFIFLIPLALLLALIGLVVIWRSSAYQYGWFLLPAVMIVVGLFQPLSVIEALDPDIARDIAKGDSLVEGRNQLRLLYSVNPLRVEGMGTDLADQITQEHAIIDSYARRGLFGEGFLNVDVIDQKRRTALNDNVSAIYLLAQFGALGGCAVILAYLFFALAPIALIFRAGGTAGSARRRLGFLLAAGCGSTLAFASLYMMAANCGLVPFTGKNLYLLSLESLSDVFESAVLLSILAGAVALAVAKRGVPIGLGVTAVAGFRAGSHGHEEFLPESLK